MNENRKEQIILATLELAAQHGLSGVSMSMIADKTGIKKPSLYNHFASKDELVEETYRFLRERAKAAAHIQPVAYEKMFDGKTASEVLTEATFGYISVVDNEQINKFYKVVYSERCFSRIAAKILIEETEKMIFATKQLFYAMQGRGLLKFADVEASAVTFAMCVHAAMDFRADCLVAGVLLDNADKMLRDVVRSVCEQNAVLA